MDIMIVALLPSERISFPVRYGTTTVIVLFALAGRWSLSSYLDQSPFLLFVPAVFLSALLFDRASGLFATGLSGLLAFYFFVPSTVRTGGVIQLFIFFLICGAITLTIEALRRTLERVAASEREKSLLFAELAHRVRNDLSLIASALTLEGRRSTDAAVKSALTSAVARISVVAEAQQRLHPNDFTGTIDLAEYLNSICRGLADFLRDVRPITVHVEALKIEVECKDAVGIGLIVNELVVNALKYAFPDGQGGAVIVTLQKVDGAISIAVRDNGVGCPDGAKLGTGFQLLQSIVSQFKGRLDRRSIPKGGCEVVVKLPIAASV